MTQTISGTYTSNVTLTSNPVSIVSATTISGTSASAIGVKGPTGTSWTVTNQGTISESGGGGVGISLASAGTLTNITGGTISAGQDGVSLANGGIVSAQSGGTISGIIGVQISGGAVTVNNAGSISGNLTSGAAITMSGGGTVTNLAGGTLSGSYGVGAVSAAATVINAGSIGDGTSLPTGAAIALKHGGGITNQSGGRIVAGLQGIYGGGAVLTLVNAGTVAGGPTTGNGVILASGGLITNQSSGLISGKYGIRALAVAATVANYGSIGGAFTLASSAGVALSAGGSLNNHTGGTITGLKGAVLTGGTVVNAGSIGGNATTTVGAGVQLSSGAGLTNQAGGTITGFNAVTAAAAATVVNAGSIGANTTSGSGVRLAAGGSITNQSGGTITAFTGILIAGAATVVNAGSIGGTTAVAFASGVTNRLVVNPGGAFTGTVSGGNTIGGTSISTLELASAATAGTLSGLGTQFINFAQTTIDSGATWTLTGTNTLAAGATLSNLGTLTDAGTLLNRGSLASSRINLNGGTLTNAAGVLLASYVYGVTPGGADTVVNLGTMASTAAAAIDLKGSGAVTNAVGGTITGLIDAVKLDGTIVALSNLGQMSATQTSASAGVYLHNGGLLTNGQAGTGTSTASIQGYYGVTFKNLAGTLGNYGTIRGNGGKGVGFATAGGTLTNGASGATAALIQGTNYGVYTGAGAVTNAATIISSSTVTPTWGVEIVNAGTVSNLGTAALIEGYGGVKIGTSGTIINAGTIESNQGAGGQAVQFTGGNARLIDESGAVFIGSIFGGTGGTAVLELASAASAGTISGLGTSVTNFTSLVFDTGANWTVRGNDSANGLGTMAITGFASGDTIDLSNFIAVNKTFASNSLVVGDGVGDFETLAIQGTFSTGDFGLASDGSGGTDVFLSPSADLLYGQTLDQAGIVATSETVTAGVMTLFNSGSTAVGTIAVGTSLATGDFILAPDGASGTDVIVNTIFGTYGSRVTLSVVPTTIASSATINTTGSTVALYGAGGGSRSWTITNGGVVNGGPATHTSGIQLGSAVSLVSTSAITNLAGGTISGYYGIQVFNSAAASVVNLAGGTIAGGEGGVDVVNNAGTVINSGLIQNVTTAAFGLGVALNQGGRVVNNAGGTITGYGGVYGSSGVTVVNAGTIIGSNTASYAVGIGGGGRLIVDPGAVFSGAVRGGFSPASTSTLELASGASAGTLVATNFTNFSTIDFDSGAVWTLDGSTTALSGAIVGFTIGDTIDLSGFAATSKTFASNSLVLSDGVNFDTLAIQGTFSTANFVIGSDGSGGTDISLQAASPPVITGTSAGQAVADNATLHPFSAVTVTDPNASQSETATITVTSGATPTNADGTLSGAGLIETNTGTYTLTAASAAALTTDLAALLFTPAAHQVAPGSTVTTGFTLAVTDTLSQTATDTTTSVVATAANDPPAISGTVAGQAVGDNATLSPFTGVTISDPDIGATETVTITLTAGGSPSDADGTLSGTGLTKTGTGTYTLTTGTPAAVSTELDQLLFTPTLHQVAPGNTITTGMTLAVTDGIIGSPVTDTTTSVVATAVNDAPQITGVDGSEQAVADNATLQPFTGVTITDPDFGATETVTITLTALELPSDADGTLSGTGLTKTGTGTYTLTSGTPAAVSTELDALVFTPTGQQVAPGGTISTGITLSVTDGIVVSPTTSTVMHVVATAVNDPPTITGAVADQALADDATLRPFSNVGISDPDFGATETVTITLTADGSPSDADGTLSGTGLTKTGTGTYTLATGTPQAATTDLNDLVFTPTDHQVAPGGTITTGMTLAVTDGIIGSPVTDTTTSVIATAQIIPCFAAGTRIATARGAVAVERLREGDMLLTVSGRQRPVQWIGRRVVDCRRHVSPGRVKPIRIAAHAFGENRPVRPLLLSPDHSVFVEDVLIPVKHLLNGTTITQIDVRTVTYYHIELPVHDVVLAEGLPAETYLETGGRSAFENGGGAMQLHPDFAPDEARVGMVWQAFGYAPLIGSDGQLERVRGRLECQAVMLGYEVHIPLQPAAARRGK